MKIEPFNMELFNDGETIETAYIHGELAMIVSKVNGKVDSQFCVDTAHILAIADAIRQKGDLK